MTRKISWDINALIFFFFLIAGASLQELCRFRFSTYDVKLINVLIIYAYFEFAFHLCILCRALQISIPRIRCKVEMCRTTDSLCNLDLPFVYVFCVFKSLRSSYSQTSLIMYKACNILTLSIYLCLYTSISQK